ncbi:MAG: tetratricopeptide repeat protein [Cyclobacteriaceae bacterium]|nr:tetratricopeptide repeat protein [Cyclobacteriaceae bacterium]
MKYVPFYLFLFFGFQRCIEVSPSKGPAYFEETNSTLSPATTSGQEIKGEEQFKQQNLTQQDLERRSTKLKEAEADYTRDPDNEDNIIWYGRRLAYLGRYQEAIAVYTEGLKKNPQSYKIYRHRGHRYITIRQFDNAIDDLQNAAFYASNAPNEIEPDGIPNSYNKPVSNIKWNIWYHMGLAYYLKGNYDKAISSYKKCMEYTNNNDLDVATTNWLYATYRKIGNTDAADALASIIPSRMRLIENRGYHDLIMMYRGFVSPDILIRRNTENNELNATIGYGIGNWYQLNGQKDNARAVFEKVTSSTQWDSFGYLAAEKELKNMNSSGLQ